MDKQKGFVENIAEKFWKFFSSVKLAVTLLIILAIVSIIGTIILQNESPERYLREYSQSTVQLFEFLGFFDMYHTWWFVLLLFLFTANLTVCTLDRFPHTWAIITAPLKPIDDNMLKALPFRKEIPLQGDMDKVREKSANALKNHGYSYIESKDAAGVQLLTQKGVFSRFGVYITHVSILLIFTGALIGSFFGFKAFLNLPEGSASRVVYLRNEPMWDQLMDSLGIAKSPVIHDPQEGLPAMPLGYYVRCDNFDVDYYIDPSGMPTGMPSEYHSTLSIFNLDGEKILDKRIRVNEPLTYHGVTFYQSSYGIVPEARGKVILNIRKKSDTQSPGETVDVEPGGSVFVPSINRTVKVLGFAPYGMRNTATGEVQLFKTDTDEYINPAVALEIYNGKKALYRTTILKIDSGGQMNMPEDYVISYGGYWGKRYTGLQVTKDPGVWVVYTGFIMLCFGPLIAFFGSHKKLWVRIQSRGSETIVLVAGSANRNRIGFERVFNKVVAEISG
ncbi:MAG TPA: cytochrome c biogenesis protein ResB [Nitrospirota bacterium]|nr:cytochrome c biogenesis protein ResB [Nitrospirota bacterium]